MGLSKPPKARPEGGVLASVLRALFGAALVALMGGFLWALSIATGVEGAETVDPATGPGRFVNVSAGTIHLREHGSASQPAILFIHDFDINGGRQWVDLVEDLDGFYSIMPDMIDFGYSTRLEERGRSHTVVGRAESMIDLLERMEIDEAVVVGAGLGGEVAAQMAALSPEVVSSLVLITPEIYGPEPQWYEWVHGWPVLGEAYNFTFFGASRSAAKRYAAGCETGGWCPNEATRQEREVTARVRGTTNALNAMGATAPASTLPSGLSNIAAPTLILWGDGDTVTPLSDGQTLAESIVGASLTLVPGTGHRPQLEDPVATAGLVAEFVGG